MKTKFDSYCINGLPEGCKYCIRGEKLVLFISGVCSRNCWYCSLSEKRKNKNVIWTNEKECKGIKDIISEGIESRAKGVGITGGDPLLFLDKVIKYSKALKKKFGKKFHIHIYLPTKLVTEEKLRRLSKCVDEIRFHPEFLIDKTKKKEDIEKIGLAKKYFKSVGIEMPLIPDKEKEIIEFIDAVKNKINFVNLNEFEISETNFNRVVKNYKLNEKGYTIKGSIDSGVRILKKCKKFGLKMHICTADTKNFFQYKNRLKLHKIMKYGKRTKDGTVVYLTTRGKLKIPGSYFDAKKNRTVLSEKTARIILGKHKIFRVEEFPTYDRDEVEVEEIKC